MIERKILAEKIKEFEIEQLIIKNAKGVGHSQTKVQRTPLGEKIIISAARPGLVVGRKGANIINMTQVLKKQFQLNNPQIEINEVQYPDLDANIVAEKIAISLERFGAARFKGIGHKAMEDVMNSGALGVEITVGGRGVPGERAKTWRFYQGYLKKSGDMALTQIRKAYATANLKTGTVGIKVSIMMPDANNSDKIITIEEKEEIMKKKQEEERIKQEKEDKKKEELKAEKAAEEQDKSKKAAGPAASGKAKDKAEAKQ